MKMKKMSAIALSFVLAFSTVCAGFDFSSSNNTITASAVTNNDVVESNDEVPEGYTAIRTFEDLYAIRNNLSGKYILMNDIDMSEETKPGGDWDINGTGWEPIGKYGAPFQGIFNGNGHSIIGMDIHGTPAYKYVGLFGYVDYDWDNNLYPEIFNLRMKECNINISNVTCKVGTIVGEFKTYAPSNIGVIRNCFSSGNINISNANGETYVGGIAGDLTTFYGYDKASVKNCYNSTNISASNSQYSAYVGGIAGGSYGYVENCYNTGIISVDANSKSGAIIGENYNQQKCYYLNGTCEGQANSVGKIMGLTEGQMKSQVAFTDWDFDKTWVIDGTSSYKYPQLRSLMQVPVTKVEMKYNPTKTTYIQGEKLNLSGGYITAYHTDDSSGEAAIKENMVSGFDMNKIGVQKVTVNYCGQKTSFNITVMPGEVKNLKSGNIDTDSAKLTWNKINDANGYIIYMYNSFSNQWEEFDRTDTNITSYTATNLSSATDYKFAVKAYKYIDDSEELTSSTLAKISVTTCPDAVTRLTNAGVTYSNVKLSWGGVQGASGYIVYKFNTSSQLWEKVASLSASTRTCTISKLNPKTTYLFSVKAYRRAGSKLMYSLKYPTLKVTTKSKPVQIPAAVTGLKASDSKTNSIKLSWKKTKGAKGYTIYYLKNGKWIKLKSTTSTSVVLKKLSSGTTYKFMVKAYTTSDGKYYYGKASKSVLTSTIPATMRFKVYFRSGRKILLKWNKIKGATGYYVYIRPSSSNVWRVTKNTSSTKYLSKSLKKGKLYYVAVTPYRKVGGKIYENLTAYIHKVRINK